MYGEKAHVVFSNGCFIRGWCAVVFSDFWSCNITNFKCDWNCSMFSAFWWEFALSNRKSLDKKWIRNFICNENKLNGGRKNAEGI